MKRGRIGRQQGVVPLPGMRDHAAAEVDRPAGGVENDLYARRIFELPAVADRRGQRTHHGRGIRLQQFNRQVDRPSGDFRLIALYVDDDVDIGHPPRHLRHAIGSAWGRRTGHFHVAAEGADLVEDLGMVGCHTDAQRSGRTPSRFIGVADQRLAGLAQEEFPRQPRRGEPRGDYDLGGFHVAERSRFFRRGVDGLPRRP